MDRIVVGMRAVETVGNVAGFFAGAGIVISAAKQGGKWAVVKTIAVAGAAIAAEQGVEQGLVAAGAGEQSIRGVRLAAAVVTLILLRRRSQVTAEKTPAPAATGESARRGGSTNAGSNVGAAAATEPPTAGAATQAAGIGSRPGSISGNPTNRLVETGTPLKNRGGWQKRWTRMTREDELRQAEAISRRYDQVIREAQNLPDDVRKQYVFEQMRKFRAEYRENFLRSRKR